MNLSRRGLFRRLLGAALAPAFPKLLRRSTVADYSASPLLSSTTSWFVTDGKRTAPLEAATFRETILTFAAEARRRDALLREALDPHAR